MTTDKRRTPWSVEDLIDFEYLAEIDASTDSSGALREPIWERDRLIYLTSIAGSVPSSTRPDRSALFKAWLDQRRSQSKGLYLPGGDVSHAWRLLVSVLVVVSFLVGALQAGTVLAVLDRNDHVNPLLAWLLTVGLQLMITTLVLLIYPLRSWLRKRYGDFPSMRMAALSWLLKFFHSRPRSKFASALIALRGARARHSRLVMAHVGMAASASVMAMSLGLAGSMVVFHYAVKDVRFGWGMTYAYGSAQVARVVDAVALPWAAIAPAAVPSEAQIEQSRLSRETPNQQVPASASRSWAFFLVASILVYGLILRLLLWLASDAIARKALHNARLESQAADELLKRLLTARSKENAQETIRVAPTESQWRRWARKLGFR